MRKYDKTNKRNIGIVLVICIIILIIFSLFIKRVNDIGKIFYTLDANSVLYDADKNKIELKSTGTLKIKWSGAYYLNYDDTETKLDKQVVVYNNASKMVNLYGTIYKINSDESIETLEDETIIEDTIIPKFYKLADRKYLLIASDIKNESGSFTANDYLIVELDKLGNATLINNKVNMKTLTETVLITSSYSFDIANEILYFDDTEINLKKIIGSTNEYVKPEEEESTALDDNKESSSTTNNNTDNSNNNVDNNTTTPDTPTDNKGDDNTSNNGTDNNNDSDNDTSNEIVNNKVYQDKNFSIIKNTIGMNYIDIDYTIYDPQNEYKNVFLEIENNTTKDVETYYLAKNGTNLKIARLVPGTVYNLVYKYSYQDESGNILYESFNTDYSITTTLPDTSIEVNKMTNKTVSFTVSESSSLMYKAVVELYIDGVKQDQTELASESAVSTYNGSFDIEKYGSFNYLSLVVKSITYSSGEVSTNVVLKVKN